MNPTTISPAAQDPLAALKPQEMSVENDESRYAFRGQLVATTAAIDAHGFRRISDCLNCLKTQAVLNGGLDYFQVFQFPPPALVHRRRGSRHRFTSFRLLIMGEMKVLHTTGQDLQRQMTSEQSFAPTFEELCEIQRNYLQLVGLAYGNQSIPPRENKQPIF